MTRIRIRRARLAPTPLGQKGIALPLALLGLVAVTLLVTTVLLTSGSEFAVSAGQKEADRSLYSANAALEQYVANQAASGSANKFVESRDSTMFDNVKYFLSVARLSNRTVVTPSSGTAFETWSLTAVPTRGRGVGGLIRVTRTLTNARINVNAGFTSGGNVTVGGSATVSSGAHGQVGCDSAAAPYSLEVAAGYTATAGSNNLDGTKHTSTVTKSGLMTSVLGMPLDSLAVQTAQIKFGPMFTARHMCPDRTGGVCPTWPNNVRPNDNATDTIYNWGCPAADIGSANCHGGQNRFVVVAIDGTGMDDIKLNGDWGQGVLMVLHSSLSVAGNFVFRGIILVDRDLKINGGNGPYDGKLEGTVVAFGENSEVTDDVRGNATIRFNRCSVNDAQSAINSRRLDDMPQVLGQPVFAWYELVR
jgi:Tfp pilus assembly protein PilX